MLIAHLPAGYLLGRAAVRGRRSASLFTSILVGSVLPDADMLWWIVVDRSVSHHVFFPHRPSTWVLVALAGAAMSVPAGRSRRWGAAALGLAAGALLHCALDSPLSGIQWLHPWSDELYYGYQIEVPTDHSPPLPAGVVLGKSWMWIWHFIHHWTFAVEIFLTGLALSSWMRGRTLRSESPASPSPASAPPMV